jgi:hypothetical protein
MQLIASASGRGGLADGANCNGVVVGGGLDVGIGFGFRI